MVNLISDMSPNLDEIINYISENLEQKKIICIYTSHKQFLIFINLELYNYLKENYNILKYININEWCNVIHEFSNSIFWTGVGFNCKKINGVCVVRDNKIITETTINELKDILCSPLFQKEDIKMD